MSSEHTPGSGSRVPRAATLFGWLAGIFSLLFVGIAGWLVHDQTTLLESASHLHTQGLPQSIEQQRLARNLETMRLEGERVLAAQSPQARQQAMFVVSLMASHPSILNNPRAREVAAETESFLAQIGREGRSGDAVRSEWERLSRRLSLAADDITVEGVSLARGEVSSMENVIRSAREKIFAALALTFAFVVVLLVLIHRRLVRPLQRIDATLTGLREKTPDFGRPAGSLQEIRAIEAAIGHLHEVLQEQESTRGELEKLAATDMLTGLNNRRNFMKLAAMEVARSQRYGRPISVAVADLDHFKRVNDEHGHATGDIALRAFADLVRATLRTTDIAGRFGGEEFSFVFPETTPEEAAVLANRLRSQLATMIVAPADGKTVRMTVSIGVADASALPLEEALSHADQALYAAKAGGRNAVMLASEARPETMPGTAAGAAVSTGGVESTIVEPHHGGQP